MSPVTTAFQLPERLAAKADPRLIDADERHLASIADCIAEQVAEVSARLDELRLAPGRRGRQALDRDLEIHRLTARLRTLQRFGVDLCLGRIVATVEELDGLNQQIATAAEEQSQVAQDIDDAQASARFNDGVLELTLPKRAAASSKRLTID